MFPDEVIPLLKQLVGKERVFTAEPDLLCYARDMSPHYGKPDVIVFPSSAEQVSEILKIANKHKLPVIPRGAGTSVTGAILAPLGGILLDMSRMNRIKEINFKDRYAVVEPGVVCQQLNNALAPNYFFPPDPGSSAVCTLGGMVSTNASGIRAVKYGTTKDYLLGLEVVLPDGRIIRTGTKAPKSSTGFDLTKLFVAAEGTLGVITELTVRFLPKPEFISFASAYFKRIEDAINAVSEILCGGIPLSACEILDLPSIQVVNKVLALSIPEVEALVLFEVDGHEAAVKEHLRKIESICKRNATFKFDWTSDMKEREKMWRARAGLVSALSRYKEGYRLISIAEDFGVQPSKLPAAFKGVHELAQKYGITVVTFGHVGDGNLHATFIIDIRNRTEWEAAINLGKEFIELALKLGGTVSAEHGIGITKRIFAPKELGAALQIMRSIKQLFDPNNILNPAKLMAEKASPLDYFGYEKACTAPESMLSFEKTADTEILACIQCGFCRTGCPIFEQLQIESANARGKVLLAYSLLTKEIDFSKELVSYFYNCTFCMNCTQTCPARIKMTDIVSAVRKKLAVDFLPAVHNNAIKNLKSYSNPFGEKIEKRTEFYLPTAKKLLKNADVLLYLGCVASYQDMNIVRSAITIFEKLGINYTLLGEQEKCCGYLAYLVGDASFKHIMGENLNTILNLGVKTVVTTCAGCYKTFKQLYTKYLSLQFEVYHIAEYLHELLKEGALEFTNKFETAVVYHDPCDIGRGLNIYEQPRELLASVPGIKLIEFDAAKELAKCCGGGGGLKGFDTKLAISIAKKRVEEALKKNADCIVSACPACKSNLKLAATELGKKAKKIVVMDLVEVLKQAL